MSCSDLTFDGRFHGSGSDFETFKLILVEKEEKARNIMGMSERVPHRCYCVVSEPHPEWQRVQDVCADGRCMSRGRGSSRACHCAFAEPHAEWQRVQDICADGRMTLPREAWVGLRQRLGEGHRGRHVLQPLRMVSTPADARAPFLCGDAEVAAACLALYMHRDAPNEVQEALAASWSVAILTQATSLICERSARAVPPLAPKYVTGMLRKDRERTHT